MATCLALFTNLSATVIFITHMEMHFFEKYKAYSEAVIGGKKADIENAKKRLFRQLGNELMNLVRVQFIISVVAYLLCVVFLPQFWIRRKRYAYLPLSGRRVFHNVPDVCGAFAFILFQRS